LYYTTTAAISNSQCKCFCTCIPSPHEDKSKTSRIHLSDEEVLPAIQRAAAKAATPATPIPLFPLKNSFFKEYLIVLLFEYSLKWLIIEKDLG
jgi:hypothetical protein